MSDPRAEFLAGERPADVALFLADRYVEDDRLERFGARVEGGVMLVVDGERGRNAFRAATGTDAMTFAGEAMSTEGAIDADLAGGTCPDDPGAGSEGATGGEAADAAGGDDHRPQFVLAFAEAQNEDVGGIYADSDVLHAYARCACGKAYSDRWTLE